MHPFHFPRDIEVPLDRATAVSGNGLTCMLQVQLDLQVRLGFEADVSPHLCMLHGPNTSPLTFLTGRALPVGFGHA